MKKKKASTRNKKQAFKRPSPRRDHRIVFSLNEAEFDALSVYCKRYRISNRSKFIREQLFRVISKRFVDDYPTLF